MISFLNSGILFLASAVVIPILIYLFAKKKPKKIIFSSIRFIKESQQQQKKKINLNNLLLLLIRMLIVLFTILAISRPAVKTTLLPTGSSHPKTALAIIIDNSYSMNYLVDTQTELDKAKQIALQINELVSHDDEIILMTLDHNWNQMNGILRFGRLDPDMILGIDITAQAAALPDVLKTAVELIEETHLPNREIIVISDRQKTALPQKIPIQTFFITTSNLSDRQNISVQNSIVSNEIVRKGRSTQVSFDLVNHADTNQQDVIYRLFMDGNTVNEKAVDLPAGQQKNLSFELEPQTAGWHFGFVEVKNERQTFDNRSYFSFYSKPEAKVAFISDLPDIPAALASILEIYCGEKDNIIHLTDRLLSLENLQDFDNIIVYRKSISAKLQFILQNTDSALIIADRDLSGQWQEYLSSIFSISFRNYYFARNHVSLFSFNQYHPITKFMINASELEFNDFWITDVNKMTLLASSQSSFALENNKTCLWLFDVDSLRNPFLVNAAFPVFAYNSLVFMAGLTGSPSLTIGERIRAAQLTLPDGTFIELRDGAYFPTKPGIYQTEDKNLAVNLDYAESNYLRMEDPKIRNLDFLNDDWQDHILHSRYGFELWKYFLILVLILIGIEIFLVKKGEKR